MLVQYSQSPLPPLDGVEMEQLSLIPDYDMTTAKTGVLSSQYFGKEGVQHVCNIPVYLLEIYMLRTLVLVVLGEMLTCPRKLGKEVQVHTSTIHDGRWTTLEQRPTRFFSDPRSRYLCLSLGQCFCASVPCGGFMYVHNQ
jgi:hypothetical protein